MQPSNPLSDVHAYLKSKDKEFTADLPTFEQDMQDDAVRQQVYDYLKGQDKEFTASFDEFSNDIGVKKKSGGVDSATGGAPTGTATDIAPEQVAPGTQPEDDAFGGNPVAAPLGYQLPGQPAPEAEQSLQPELVSQIPFAPGTQVAPLAANLPFASDAPVESRAPAAEEMAALAQLPVYDGATVRADGRGVPQAAYGTERVAIPNDYTGAVPAGTYELNLAGPGDRTQYFDRPLSKTVDGKEQTYGEALTGKIKNALYSMGQGVVEGAQAIPNAASALTQQLTGIPQPYATEGTEASAAIEQAKTPVAPYYRQSFGQHKNWETLGMAAADYAPLVIAQVAQTLAPELRAPAALQRALGFVTATAFDADMYHAAREHAKQIFPGDPGKADLYTLFEGTLTVAGFKAGSKLMSDLGDKLAFKASPFSLKRTVATDAVERLTALEKQLGRKATDAEYQQVLHDSLRAALPKLAQVPKEAFQQAATFAGVEGVKTIGNQLVAPALGGTADDLGPDPGMGLLGRMGDAALAGAGMGVVTGLTGAALPTTQLMARPGGAPVEATAEALQVEDGAVVRTDEIAPAPPAPEVAPTPAPIDEPTQAAPATARPVEPEPSAPETATAAASPPDAVGGEVPAADATAEPEPTTSEPLPDAEPDPAHVKPLTKQQQATNNTLDALDRYNALKPGQKKGKEGSAARATVASAAKKAGIEVSIDKEGKVTLAGGKRLTRSNEYTATTPAANHVPLDARPEDAHAFMETMLFNGDQANVPELQGLGIKVRGKELSARELGDAVKDIRAGRNTLRAQLVLDALENAHRQGYVEKSTGTGMATQKFRVPIEDYFSDAAPEAGAGERELSDDELDALLASDPQMADAITTFTDPATGEIDYAKLAQQGGRGALETFFDVTPEVATKITALANERASQPPVETAGPGIQRGPTAIDEATALPAEPTQSGAGADGATATSAGAITTEIAPDSTSQNVTPDAANKDLVADNTQNTAGSAPATLAEQNVAAKADFAEGLAAFRAARKKNSGVLQSSVLGVPAFSAEEAAALTKMAKAIIKLGAVKTKQVIADLRSAGFTDDDATNRQLRPFIKKLLEDEGVRQPKAPKAAPQRPTDPTNAKERQGAQSIERSGLSDALSQGLRDRGTNLYTPKPLAETKAHVDRIIATEGIDRAYYTATHASGDIPKDVHEVLRIQVMAHYDNEVRRLAAEPDANAAAIDEAVERAGQVADVYVAGGTEDGRALRARQTLQEYAPSVAVARLGREVKETAAAQRKTLEPAGRKRAKAVRKVKAQALDAALASPGVQTALGLSPEPAAARGGKAVVDPVGWGSKNKFFTKESANKAREALRKLGLSTIVPPELIHFLGFHIEAGARSFADVSARAVRDLGQKVRPLLPEAYEEAKKEFVRRGGDNKGFDGPDAVEGALRSELAENLAERIVSSVKPARVGVFDPVRDMLDTLTKKVRESLPARDKTPRAARELLALAINNRREYTKVFEESRGEVLKKIAASKLSEGVKQQMVDALTDFMDEATGNVYAQQHFARAVREAEDASLANLPGKNRGDKLDYLAKMPETAYRKVIEAIQDHVTAGVKATDSEANELRAAVAESVNQKVLARRRALRGKQGIYEEGQEPDPKAANVRPTLSARVRDLLALRATDQQIADKLAPAAVREGLQTEGKRIQQIARDHLNDPTDVGHSLADAFVRDAGIPASRAKVYAAAIEKEFDAQIAKARDKAVQDAYSRKVRTREPQAATDLTDRVRKLYTLSPTDEGRVLGLVADEAGLPELTKADNTRLYQLAQAIADAKGDNAKAKAVQNFYLGVKTIRGLTGWEQVKTVMYANMLSGLGTHAKNFGTTGWNAAADLFYNTGWAGALAATHAVRTRDISALKLALGPAKAFFTKGTGGSQAFQMLMLGVRPTGYEGKFGEASDLEAMADQTPKNRKQAVMKAYANKAKYWMRLLGANDLLFSGAAEQMWAHNIALSEALAEGRTMPTSEIQQRVNERLYDTSVRVEDAYNQAVQELGPAPTTGKALYNAQVRIRTQELMEVSRDERLSAQAKTLAAQTAFNGPMQGFLGSVMSGFGKLTEIEGPYGAQPLKGILPFTKIVANVANEVLNYSPVGMVRAARGKTGYGTNNFVHEYTPMERAIVGMKAATFVLMAAYAFGDEDDLTGAGPSDPGQNRAWRERGHKPYTFHGWNYQGIPFFYNALSTVAAMREAQVYDGVDFDNDTLFQKRATAMVATTAQSAFNAIGLASIQDMMNALNDPSHGKTPGERMMRWASRTAGAVGTSAAIPAAGLFRSVSRGVQQAAGATKREAGGGISLVAQDLPFARNTLPKVYDDLGNEVPVGSTLPFAPIPVPRDETGATEKINAFLDKYDLFVPKINRYQSDMQVLKSRAGTLTAAETEKMRTMTDKDRAKFILAKLGGEEAMSPEDWQQFYPKRGKLIKEKLLMHMAQLEELAKTDPRKLRKRLNRYYRQATKKAKIGIDFTDPEVKPYGEEEQF